MLFALRGARDGDFAFWMERLLAADRTQDDRRFPFRAKKIDGHVDPADVDQPAYADRVVTEPVAVRLDRPVVVGAGREITPVCRRHLAVGDRLEVEYVERVCRGRDHVVLIPPEPTGGQIEVRNNRARGEVAQQAAPGL